MWWESINWANRNGLRRKWLSDLTFSGIVSESPVLCWVNRILAWYLLGLTSSSGTEESLWWPQFRPRTNVLVLRGEKVWKFQGFSTPQSSFLAPCPLPPAHFSTAQGQKSTLLQCLYCIIGASWPDCPLLGKVKNKKTKKYLPSPSPHPPPQLHSNVWTHLVTRTICKSGLGTTLWTVPTQDI